MRKEAIPFLLAGRRALLLGLIWYVLTGPDPEALMPGLLAVALASWVSLRLLPPVAWVRVWRLAVMLPIYLRRSVAGGVDVARRALDPRLPLSPGWVEVPCGLSGGGRALLGGALSLMPGTLAAGMREGRLLVHALDRGQPVAREVAADEAAIARALAEPREPDRA